MTIRTNSRPGPRPGSPPAQQRRSRNRRATLAAVAAALLVVTACGDSGSLETPGGQGTGATVPALSPATLNAAGATFPQAFYQEVIAAFQAAAPTVTVNYGGGGSGTGRQQFKDGVVDFAGTDGLVKPADAGSYPPFFYIPTVAAPITVAYNLPGVTRLTLDASAIARIFQRQITRWNDPAIAALNPGAALPDAAVVVVHRADGSGTTENFTRYLAAAAPGTWTLKSGSTVEWPTDTQAGNGNTGVAQIVKSTPGAVGYVDLSDAKASGLSLASVVNQAGKAVAPTLEATSAALAGVVVGDDLTYDPLNASGDAAYPIAAPTWILVKRTYTEPAEGAALKAFLTFLLTDGQSLAASVDYARLPSSLQQKALSRVEQIAVAPA